MNEKDERHTGEVSVQFPNLSYLFVVEQGLELKGIATAVSQEAARR